MAANEPTTQQTSTAADAAGNICRKPNSSNSSKSALALLDVAGDLVDLPHGLARHLVEVVHVARALVRALDCRGERGKQGQTRVKAQEYEHFSCSSARACCCTLQQPPA